MGGNIVVNTLLLYGLPYGKHCGAQVAGMCRLPCPLQDACERMPPPGPTSRDPSYRLRRRQVERRFSLSPLFSLLHVGFNLLTAYYNAVLIEQ